MPVRTSPRSALGAAAVGAFLLVLGACSDEPERDESGAITEEGDADVFSMQVGDCLPSQSAATGEVSEVPVVPCDQPHEGEIYHAFDVTDTDTFPGSFEQYVQQECIPQFAEFVGTPYESSALELTWLEPTSQSWSEGNDREILCIVVDPAGEVTGSLEGVTR